MNPLLQSCKFLSLVFCYIPEFMDTVIMIIYLFFLHCSVVCLPNLVLNPWPSSFCLGNLLVMLFFIVLSFDFLVFIQRFLYIVSLSLPILSSLLLTFHLPCWLSQLPYWIFLHVADFLLQTLWWTCPAVSIPFGVE